MYFYEDQEVGWILDDIKLMTSPILTIMDADLNDDGVDEIVILAQKGMLVLEVKKRLVGFRQRILITRLFCSSMNIHIYKGVWIKKYKAF